MTTKTTHITPTRSYPTYQFHACTVSSAPSSDIFSICILESLRWLRFRLTDFTSLPEYLCLPKEKLDKLLPLPKINLVATQGKDDNKALFDACGNKEYRKKLDKQFKNTDSNFTIAIVVDMWITGFDVPSLAVMYIDKPLQKHTLIQTISRVNRVFEGKDKGLVVDYIGIKDEMMEAVKRYGSPQESPIDELNISLGIFRNHLKLIDDLLVNFNAEKFYNGEPLERLNCLNNAADTYNRAKSFKPDLWGFFAV